MAQGFPKACRLLKRREFITVYASGTPYRNAGFHLFLRRRQEEPGATRLGLTVKRTVGGSATRNRLRRWTRETFRLSYECIRPGFDVVLNYHPALARATRQEFDRLLKNILDKAGLYRD
jgi:ribonuclease P protein component